MSKNFEIFQGDCLEIMPKLADNSVDMVLCDLPYGVTSNNKDIVLPFELLWEQYNRIAHENTPVILFGQGKFFIELVNSNLKDFRYDLIWDKKLTSGFLNANNNPLRQHEQIGVFYKKQPTYNPQKRIGNPSHSKGKKYLTKEGINNNYNEYNSLEEDVQARSVEKFPTSVLVFQKPHSSICVHPTQKPVALLEYLIKTYTNPGDVVLDNCMGSGSTGVACMNTGRRFVGIEKEAEYFDIAQERISCAEQKRRQFEQQGWDERFYQGINDKIRHEPIQSQGQMVLEI